MRRSAILAAALALLTAPALAQDGQSTANVTSETVGFTQAVVASAVNVRSAPDSRASDVIGTLQPGGSVLVKCSRGWCELADGGYVAQKFLTFGGGSFDTLAPPTEGDSTGAEPSAALAANLASQPVPPAALPDFSGTWTVVDAAGQPQRVLTLTQDGANVAGTLEAPSRVAKITGTIGGTRLAFSYQMLDAKNAPVASGTGTLDIGEDGKSLKGRLMLNGLVLGDIDALRQ